MWINNDGKFELRDPEGNVSRKPKDPEVKRWNEGDLFCETADVDHDGLVDLLLASGDYPDPQKLRLYRQLPGGEFADVTLWSGLLTHRRLPAGVARGLTWTTTAIWT